MLWGSMSGFCCFLKDMTFQSCWITEDTSTFLLLSFTCSIFLKHRQQFLASTGTRLKWVKPCSTECFCRVLQSIWESTQFILLGFFCVLICIFAHVIHVFICRLTHQLVDQSYGIHWLTVSTISQYLMGVDISSVMMFILFRGRMAFSVTINYKHF